MLQIRAALNKTKYNDGQLHVHVAQSLQKRTSLPANIKITIILTVFEWG